MSDYSADLREILLLRFDNATGEQQREILEALVRSSAIWQFENVLSHVLDGSVLR